MSSEEQLGQYLKTVRQDRGDESRGEAEERVESILSELNLPWKAAGPDMWTVDSDVGTVNVGLADSDEVLSIWQLIFQLRAGRRKKQGDFFHSLLRVNAATMGAALAIHEIEGEEWVSVIARLAAIKLDKEELAMALQDVFATSKLFDPSDEG